MTPATPATSAPSPHPEEPFLEELRRHRAELRESMGALEQALASPPSRDRARWASRVHVAVVELAADFREHVQLTEGADGLYEEVARTAPRLATPVAQLVEDHGRIRALVDDLLTRAGGPESDAGVAEVRELATSLLGRLVRHRQRGSDLVFDAYEFDIGGET